MENDSTSYFSDLYSTYCLLFSDTWSLIMERNQLQQFDQGCSHLTFYVNVLTLQKKTPPSILWPALARWRRKAQKGFVPYGTLLILLQEKGLVWAELCCFSLGKKKKKNNQAETYTVFHTHILCCEDSANCICESYVRLNVRELLSFGTNNLPSERKEMKSK